MFVMIPSMCFVAVAVVAIVVKVFIVVYERKEKELFGHMGPPERSFDSLEEERCLND
uniref:Uncharacterized protein n=1 Tax=Globisporangium ultimum (strain ATCC 200006 / CBS 805.95 / DAOM BR144) TaxID=431595 RepID=K3X0B8_GLOUD